jgi:hypothetical protein
MHVCQLGAPSDERLPIALQAAASKRLRRLQLCEYAVFTTGIVATLQVCLTRIMLCYTTAACQACMGLLD